MQVGKAEEWACDSQQLARIKQDAEPAQVARVVQKQSAKAGGTGDPGLIAGSGEPPGAANGSAVFLPGVAWWATAPAVTKGGT